MIPDATTINVYNAKAQEYADLPGEDGPDQDLRDFIALLAQGAHVLDLGCGPAHASVFMRDAGFVPDPVDASGAMVTLANERHQIGARLATFDDITGDAIYDGVWANFSLLHARRDALPVHLAALVTALKPGGYFHIGMKTGAGMSRDKINRLYTYVTVPELTKLLTNAGLTVIATREDKGMGLDGTVSPWVIMRAQKEIDG